MTVTMIVVITFFLVLFLSFHVVFRNIRTMYTKYFILLTLLSVKLAQTKSHQDVEGNPADASVVATNTKQPALSTTSSTTTTSIIETTTESVLPIDPQRECEQDVCTKHFKVRFIYIYSYICTHLCTYIKHSSRHFLLLPFFS